MRHHQNNRISTEALQTVNRLENDTQRAREIKQQMDCSRINLTTN